MAAYDDRLGGFEVDFVRASVFFFFSMVYRDNDAVCGWRTRGAHEASVDMCTGGDKVVTPDTWQLRRLLLTPTT